MEFVERVRVRVRVREPEPQLLPYWRASFCPQNEKNLRRPAAGNREAAGTESRKCKRKESRGQTPVDKENRGRLAPVLERVVSLPSFCLNSPLLIVPLTLWLLPKNSFNYNTNV